MKRIILIFCLGLILNSCTKEPLAVYDTDADMLFKIKTSSPVSKNGPPASLSSTDNINDITILVFEGDGNKNYLYRRSGITPVDNQFTANILLTNDPVIIHVFANPNDNVNSVIYSGKTESEVISSLTTELDLNEGTNAFPMHSSLSLPKISESLTIATDIYLLRAIALVDIDASTIDENIFTLNGAYVYHTPNKGRWISDFRIDENGDPATPIVTASTMPALFTPIVATPATTTISVNKIEEQLFIYENSLNSNPTSRIVVSGIFNSNGTTAYYPVDFTISGASVNILRNHHYTVNISAITGSGYTNVLDAANGESIDITADIIAWNSIDIDGGIESEVIFNVPSKVLLNHVDNGNSYTRTINYNSNKNVKLFINGVEIMPPTGGATSIDLTIPTEQGNWLTKAEWIPTSNLEGRFEFTHSVSEYVNPLSYILTLKSGGITRNMEVFVNNSASSESQSNCYMVPLGGKTINIPAVPHANSFWSGDGGDPTKVLNSADEWYAEVIWADFEFDGKVTIEKDGTTASDFGIGSEDLGITVGALTKPGNVIIGLKKKGANTGKTDYLWSWHLWVTDYDPDTRTDSESWAIDKTFNTTGGQVHSYSDAPTLTVPFWSGVYDGSVIMDRNLGAITSIGSGEVIPNATVGLDANGMYYQWGRKDPYPSSSGINSEVRVPTWGVTSWSANVLGPQSKAYSVNTPHIFIGSVLGTTTGDWQPRDDQSWIGTKGEKSLYDPCPSGWKVIPIDALSNFGIPSTAVETPGAGTINFGAKYTSGEVTAWYPGAGAIYGYLDPASGLSNTGNYWSTTIDGAKSRHMYFINGIVATTTDLIPAIYRSYAYNVRCLKE